jgi:hypothetical protein
MFYLRLGKLILPAPGEALPTLGKVRSGAEGFISRVFVSLLKKDHKK